MKELISLKTFALYTSLSSKQLLPLWGRLERPCNWMLNLKIRNLSQECLPWWLVLVVVCTLI